TQAEVAAVRADPAQLGALVDAWMLLPQYQTKMLRFFQLAFQQTQINSGSFGNMLDQGQLQVFSAPMLQNLQEGFARTMLDADARGTPFTGSMTTQTYAMTPALQVFYALLDAWQIDNSLTGIHDLFRTANPNLNVTVSAASGPIPLAQTLDPTSPNYMHW